MTQPPWDPNFLMRRPEPPSGDSVAVLAGMVDVPFDTEADAAVVMWYWSARQNGSVLPVIWPMTLHRHDQDCGRA